MKIACTAETDGKGRCRNWAVVGDKDGFCAMHASLRDGGKTVKLAVRPGKVLVKANINPNWAEKFLGLGIKKVEPNFAENETKHVAQAKAMGRQAYTIREVADSGVPVFDGGVQSVTVAKLLAELGQQGYKVVDIHIFQRPNRNPERKELMSTLVITCSATEDDAQREQVALPAEVVGYLTNFGQVHVWANPPKPDGTVIHTVNCTNRAPDASVMHQLVFVNGLWGVRAA